MEKRKVLYFELLGTFLCGSTEEEIARNGALTGKFGKKALSFLQYLIVHHGHSISAEELIEQFWSDSNDPANALRNMLFRVRGLLKSMFPEEEGIFLTLQDCYAWNTEISLELDTEKFESLCLKARRAEGKEYCRMLCQAVSIYKGDFLTGNDSEWARSLRQYYQTLYLDACRAVLPLLYKEEQWLEVISICSQAYMVDFSLEDFTAYQMKALIALGQPGQAVEKYEAFRDRMLQEYEIPPPESIEQLHALAAGLGKVDMNEQDIFRLICEGQPDSHAFFCTFGTFQSIVALERRHLQRSGQTSALVLISLGGGAAPGTDSRRLEKILLEKLRTGDPIARLEAGTYVIMLTGASIENAGMVFGRIDSAFHRTYRHSAASLSFRARELEPFSEQSETEEI